MKRLTFLAAVVALSATMLMSGASSAYATSSQSQGQAARHALEKYLKSYRPLVLRAKTSRVKGQPNASYNWSGYVDTPTTNGPYTGASGSWKQPAVACTAEQELAATWVGLDGYSDDTVEQDGTLAWCFEGTAYYYDWFEMYPAGLEIVDVVAPGDHITASVDVSAGTDYTLAVSDFTDSASSFSATATCSSSTCLDASAEWIAERPAFSTTGIAPLADYGKWKVTGASVIGSTGFSGPITTYPYTPLYMVDSTDSYYLSRPSALNSAGNSFRTKWLNSYGPR